MKRIPGSLLVCALALSVLPVFAKPADNPWNALQPDQAQVSASLNIVELMKRHHYSKPPLDDTRSRKIFDGYLKALDPSHSLFDAADIADFEPWRTRFDNFLKDGNLEPGFTIYKRYLDRQKERLDYTQSLLAQGVDKLNFKTEESLQVDRKNVPWPKDEDELHDLWRKQLKDQVLRQKLSGKNSANIQKTLTRRYQSQHTTIAQTRSEDIFRTYINAFVESYDPHSDYLSPDDAENFDMSMSLSLEGIGAVLQTDDDHVKISSLVPGGPADKSKQLAAADRIVAVAQGNGELVDVLGKRLEDVVKLIRGPKGSVVRLEVIPASNAPNNETTKIVSIVREAVKLEDQAAKKSILKLEQGGQTYKLGVIDLPTFYLDFKAFRAGDPNYTSTTRDVRRLIGELQKEQVDGIVLDLRNNGGGSLQEVNELVGLFIPRGPTVLIRSRDGQVDVLASENRRAYYTGPLAVLVNRLSASASEIFAGAMQDYRRALIIGGQTFGKGTVQNIQPLNQGELKMTLAKFYRVSGQSTQNKGVIPDVQFPADIDTKEIGESALPEALPWDTIKPVLSLQNDPLQPFLETLRKRHEERTANNPDFVFGRKRLDLIQALMKDTTLSLNETERRAYQKKVDGEQLALENARRLAKGEKPLDKLEDEDDKVAAKSTPEDDSHPEKDAYLSEAGQILLDYIGAQNQIAANH